MYPKTSTLIHKQVNLFTCYQIAQSLVRSSNHVPVLVLKIALHLSMLAVSKSVCQTHVNVKELMNVWTVSQAGVCLESSALVSCIANLTVIKVHNTWQVILSCCRACGMRCMNHHLDYPWVRACLKQVQFNEDSLLYLSIHSVLNFQVINKCLFQRFFFSYYLVCLLWQANQRDSAMCKSKMDDTFYQCYDHKRSCSLSLL